MCGRLLSDCFYERVVTASLRGVYGAFATNALREFRYNVALAPPTRSTLPRFATLASDRTPR